jgi:DNA-binding transcriptional LysR family regulator
MNMLFIVKGGKFMDTIEGMRAFIAVAETQSFTAGARKIGVSTKLASKYVKQLEERLSAQLFNRTTRSVALTDTGRAYFARSASLIEQFDETEALIHERHAELAGPIRITAPTGYGGEQLIDALCPFQAAHPNVVIDLHLTDKRVAMVEEGFDLALRFGTLDDLTLITRKLLSMRIVVFASADYLAQNGRPHHPKTLFTHNCLTGRASLEPGLWAFKIDGKPASVRVRGDIQVDTPRAIARLAACGRGIGRAPLYAVQPYVDAGTLELLLEDMEASEFGLYAVYPPSRHLTARIRALIDHLAATL